MEYAKTNRKKMLLNLPRKPHGAKNANAEREALEAIKQAAEVSIITSANSQDSNTIVSSPWETLSLAAKASELLQYLYQFADFLLDLKTGKEVCIARGLKIADSINMILDSGCTAIMTHNIDLFDPSTFKNVFGRHVYLGDDTAIEIEGMGTVVLKLGDKEERFENALYVPKL
ncbi:hypothetical protein HDU99_001395, partial [Rhizoclosmatium hyalinum]